jgi:hypothetical protein
MNDETGLVATAWKGKRKTAVSGSTHICCIFRCRQVSSQTENRPELDPTSVMDLPNKLEGTRRQVMITTEKCSILGLGVFRNGGR